MVSKDFPTADVLGILTGKMMAHEHESIDPVLKLAELAPDK